MKRVGSCGRFRARSRAARRRKRPGRSLSRRASDNGNYDNRQPAGSGASPPARSAPDSLTFSRPARTNPAREARPTFARSRPDMQSGERKSAAECMFMQPLQSEGKAIRTSAARAPRKECAACVGAPPLTTCALIGPRSSRADRDGSVARAPAHGRPGSGARGSRRGATCGRAEAEGNVHELRGAHAEARAPIGAAPPVARAHADHTTRPAERPAPGSGARGSRGAPERNPARRRSAEGNAQGRAG